MNNYTDTVDAVFMTGFVLGLVILLSFTISYDCTGDITTNLFNAVDMAFKGQCR